MSPLLTTSGTTLTMSRVRCASDGGAGVERKPKSDGRYQLRLKPATTTLLVGSRTREAPAQPSIPSRPDRLSASNFATTLYQASSTQSKSRPPLHYALLGRRFDRRRPTRPA